MRAPFRIGLLGMGHVGGALAGRLVDGADRIAEAAGRPIKLEAIAVAHPAGRTAAAPIVPPESMLDRHDLDAIVELIGGLEPAHTYINRALAGGRQVISANKQVIAQHGPALARLGPLRFEASVASAIPIVETLAETLAAQEPYAITGILNGTTNTMLEAMAAGSTYDDALADAQRRGLAEADPSADVDAHDPAAKLAILVMLAFRCHIDPSTIKRVGIRGLNLERQDPRSAGYVIKLIAAAQLDGGRIRADVRPRRIPQDEPIARVNGPMNAIALDTAFSGSFLFEGLGAGPDAAAGAVLGDLIRAARDAPASAGEVLAALAAAPPAEVAPLGSSIPYPAAS